MYFHFFGALVSALFLFTWYGLFHQFKILRDRRKLGSQRFTDSLSSQQFITSFAAFFAIFFLGLTRAEFNHYLVWTRLGALLLLVGILFEIHLDRRSTASYLSVASTAIALAVGLVLMLLRPLPFAIGISADILTVIMTFVLACGIIHQIRLLDNTKNTNQNIPLSKRLLSSLLIKDFSTVAFGLSMPIHAGWPLLLLNGSSFLLRGYLLIRLYRLS
ncbi:MAG: hypothetical protein F6J93_28915 [Oscillatoria sp. SIO1A7]|nr:hypothetical protein [Oscillatoria sp. SIO1A7]